MLFAACQKDEGFDGGVSEQTITVTVPGQESLSRAAGDGTSVDRCVLQIYRDGAEYGEQMEAEVTDGKATFNLRLVAGQTYDFVFWADKEGYYNTTDLSTITWADGKDYTGNDEGFDAFFYALTEYEVKEAFTENVTLKRPFGQLNIKTTDLNEIYDESLKPTRVKVAFTEIPTMFNAWTGEVGNETKDITYTAEVLNTTGDLSVDYILANPDESALANFSVTFLNGENPINTNSSFTNIPIRRNYQTNVSGNLLTKVGDFNVTIDPVFVTPAIDHDIPVEVVTAERLVEALADPEVTQIAVLSNIDLSTQTTEALTFTEHKIIDIAEGAIIQLGNANWLTAEKGITLTGKGKIDNTSADNSALSAGYQKSLIHVKSGECVIDGVTLINDPDYHWHGNSSTGRPYNSAAIAYWNDANVTIRNAHIESGEFTICGMGAASGVITLEDSYFESTSSNKDNGSHWAYAMRLYGSKIRIKDCEVKGVQGGISIEKCQDAEISSGKYYTVNTEGNVDAFYPVYVTNGAVVTITGGEFVAANDRSGGLAIEGTSAVVSGDNDTGLPVGSVILKGGKFSGKAYNHETKEVYKPADGYEYKAITDDASGLKWEVVPVTGN